MESFLWALNLLALCYLCYWALRQDTPPKKKRDDVPLSKHNQPPSPDR